MFFPERITNILPTDRVLEIGPGSQPHPRADVYLERSFSKEEALAQSGFATPKDVSEKVVYYDGGKFPFANKEFDYIICSHVVEHIAANEVPFFISELERVGRRGFIEVPNFLYELHNNQSVHKLFCGIVNNELIYIDKQNYQDILDFQLISFWRDFFYEKIENRFSIFSTYRESFFDTLEWSSSIKTCKIESLEALIMLARSGDKKKGNEKELPKLHISILEKVCKKILFPSKKIYLKLIELLRTVFPKRNIARTAIIDITKLVEIDHTAEVKDYVIIRTFTNTVSVGKYSQINPFTVIYGGSGVTIGNNVMVAPHVMIAAGNHKINDLSKPMRWAGDTTRGPIHIEDDVWIGANSTIADGVRIGKGSVVAANSLVNKDIEPYSVVGGVPARLLFTRK